MLLERGTGAQGTKKWKKKTKQRIGNEGLGFILGFVPIFHFFQVHTFQRTHLDEVKITSTILILMIHTAIYLFKKFFIFIG